MTVTLDPPPVRTAAVRSNGRLGAGQWSGRPVWVMRCRPDVTIRAKRWFPRAQQTVDGTLYLQQTPDVARDLEAFVFRYPLAMTEATAAALSAAADGHRATEQQIADILSGHAPPRLRQEAARPLRGYQQQAADLAPTVGGLLLGDDVGLGKSATAVGVLLDPAALPAVIVCPANLQRQWLREVNTVAPWLTGHIVTTKTVYDPAPRCGGRTPDVLIISYSKLAGWCDHMAGPTTTLILDEVQEVRRGGDAAKGRAAAQIAAQAAIRLGLSATPVFNYGDEVWNIYNILHPGRLGSRDEFLREWGGGSFGTSHAVKDPAALGAYLRGEGILLRRTRRDVHRELPDPILITQWVEADTAAIDEAARDAERFARLLLDDTSDVLERGQAARQVDWRMRHATGVAKAAYVAGFVNMLLESEQKILLAGWHREVYSIWLTALARHNPVLYTGTESPKAKDEAVQAFVDGNSRVMIMSLRSGAGLDGLQEAASVVVFGELDWSPGMHHQVVGRLARDGQESTVVAYFMLSDEGTDPLMADTLAIKQGQSVPLMDPDRDLLSPVGGDGDRTRLLAERVLSHCRGQQTLPVEPAEVDRDRLLYGQAAT